MNAICERRWFLLVGLTLANIQTFHTRKHTYQMFFIRIFRSKFNFHFDLAVFFLLAHILCVVLTWVNNLSNAHALFKSLWSCIHSLRVCNNGIWWIFARRIEKEWIHKTTPTEHPRHIRKIIMKTQNWKRQNSELIREMIKKK